jgi:hypothetical protein
MMSHNLNTNTEERSGESTIVERIFDIRTLISGFRGGLVATCVMTTFRMLISHSLPPTANLWSQYVAGGELEEHRIEAMVLHFFYGAAAGSVFAVMFTAIDPRTPLEPETEGLLTGLLYSIPFTLIGEIVMLHRILGMDLDSDESMIFHAGHLIYGITLGAWIGSRIDRSE